MAKPIVVNCELYWAELEKKNKLSGKYQVDLSNLSDDAVEKLEEVGLKIKDHKEGQGNFITAKSNNTIRAYNASGDSLEGVLIGNGSKARAVLGWYDWKNPAGKEGRSPSILKLVVDDLIEFEGSNSEYEDYDLDEAL